MSETTTKQPLVDVNHQRVMNAKRDERRDIVHACIFMAQRNATAAGTPGVQAFWTKEDLVALIPDGHKHCAEQFIGDAFSQKWITTGMDENSIEDHNRFAIVPQGAGVFRAAFDKAGSKISPKDDAMRSSSARPKA